MSALSIQCVTKAFGAVEVVHGVSFDIADGEFVVLVGPSGCGKSTLLRMIAGLEDVSGGEIRIGDRVVNQVRPRDRDVAMVFQNYALYPHMTVARNMGFSLRLRGERREVIDRKVKEAASVLGLDEYLDRYPRQLSGGQRQRVAMGRSIVRNPRVFLFDEPLSNLDARLRVQMRAEIRTLHQRLKTTTVYVTHDQIEAMTMADRIVVLKDGRVEQIGAPLELYDRPTNLFVAGFIGSPAMNVLRELPVDAALAPANDGTHGLQPVRPGQHVVYGVRPEHVVLSPGGARAEVVLVEPTGSETQVVMKVGDQDVLALVRERVSLRPGDTVGITIDPARVHRFDAQTGIRTP
jgi:multiple sugar transport system ATP-binding protein